MNAELNTKNILAAAISITALIIFPLVSSAIDIEQVWPQFSKYEKELRSKFVENKKIRTHSKQYVHPKWKSELAAEVNITTISSLSRVRTDISIHKVKESKQVVRAMIYDGDELYYLSAPDKKLAIESHYYENNAALDLSRLLSGFNHTDTMSFNGKLDVRRQFKTFSDPRFASHQAKAKPVENTTLDGKPAFKLVVTSSNGQVMVAYYDPENSGALLRYEASSVYDVEAKKYLPIRHIGTMTYAPSPLGYPVPKEHRSWFQQPDGTIVPDFETEYLEYSDYTPTADDFDLEKQYGIKPLPRSDSAGPPPEGKLGFGNPNRGIGRWLWAVVAVLVAVTLGLAALNWRKRRRTAGENSGPRLGRQDLEVPRRPVL